MLTLAKISKHYGAQILFQDASLQVGPRCRYGVVGANGSGKSTLLRIIAGEEEATSGQIAMPNRTRLGVLRQDHFEYEDVPVLDVVMMGNRELWDAMVARDELLAHAHEHFDTDRYAELEDIVLRFDGYGYEARAAEILGGLAIPAALHRKPLSALSGGFKLRVLLAQVLAGEPDLLLLDEPTNHLDILSIHWLETFLEAFKGAALVISHDHRFLDNVATHIIDVDYQRVTLYSGSYDDFMRAKQADHLRLETEIAKRQREIADHRAFIDRFKAKATKARQAKSKMKKIEKIVIEELPRSSRQYPRWVFAAQRPSGKVAVELDGIEKAYGEQCVLDGVSLKVMRGDRLAIIGPNGIGKSTLLKIMVGAATADAGSVAWGYETHPGYFPQDHAELLGDTRETLQEWLWARCPAEPIGFVRGKLAQALFTKDEVHKKIPSLSGGEAARLIFAALSVQQPNVLVLDEPTNHLDMEGIEALADALDSYDGTIIFVSHDRWLVSRMANRILEITPTGREDFRGTYEAYPGLAHVDHLDAAQVVRQAREAARRRGGRGASGAPG